MSIVVPSQSALTEEASAVSLARYAAIIRYPECSFFGVARSGDQVGECREIWTKMQRDMVSRYLAEAQEEIEAEVGYFLSPRYVVGRLADEPGGNDRYVDDQAYSNPVKARWPKVIEAGVRAVETISLGAAVSHAADPAVIGPIATTVTDPDEIALYHPGTDVEINPSAITLSGGNVTLYVPRCRIVKAALADNPASGLDYEDLTNFEATVDVRRVYTDASTNAVLVAPHTCSAHCDATGCGEHTRTACLYVANGLLGILHVRPATYTDGAWRSGGAEACCTGATRMRLNYRAGLKTLTRQAEDTIVRLAHAKMPTEPCGCAVSQMLWRRDRNTPEILTRERLNCPFGMSDGSWIAWRFAQAMRQVRGSVL